MYKQQLLMQRRSRFFLLPVSLQTGEVARSSFNHLVVLWSYLSTSHALRLRTVSEQRGIGPTVLYSNLRF